MIIDPSAYTSVFLVCMTIIGFAYGVLLYWDLPWSRWSCLFIALGYIFLFGYDWLMVEHYQVNLTFSWRQTLARSLLCSYIWLKNLLFLYHVTWRKRDER